MFIGKNQHKDLIHLQTKQYRDILRRLMTLITNESQDYSISNLVNTNTTDKQSVQDFKKFNSCILILKSKAENQKKNIPKMILIQVLKIALNKQSENQMQKKFKLKYSSIIQNEVIVNDIISLIKQIKKKCILVYSIGEKMKQISNKYEDENITIQVQNLVNKIKYYQKVIAQISQFPKSNSKIPHLINGKLDQLIDNTIKRQIQNIYTINNIVLDISQKLIPFKQNSKLQSPKQTKDILISNIVNPLNKLIEKVNHSSQYTISNNTDFSSFSVQRGCPDCAVLLKKWNWMKNLLIMNTQKKDITKIGFNEKLFEVSQNNNIKQLINTLKYYNQYRHKIMILIKRMEEFIIKDKNILDSKAYGQQQIIAKLQNIIQPILHICQEMSKLPIIKEQKQNYKLQNNIKSEHLNAFDQFIILKNNLKGNTQKWYYQLAYEMTKRLKIFDKQDQLNYQNMAKERKRFLIKIEQILKSLEKYQKSNYENTKVNQVGLNPITKREVQKIFGGSKQLQNEQIISQKNKLQQQLNKIKQKCYQEINKQNRILGNNKPQSYINNQQIISELISIKNKRLQVKQVQLNRLYKSLQQLSEEKEKTQKQFTQIQIYRTKQQNQIRNNLKQIKSIQQQNRELKQRIKSLQNKQKQLQKLKNLKQELIKINNQFQNQKRQNAVLTQEIKRLNSKISNNINSQQNAVNSIQPQQKSTTLIIDQYIFNEKGFNEQQSLDKYQTTINQFQRLQKEREFIIEQLQREIKELKQNQQKIIIQIQAKWQLQLQKTNQIHENNIKQQIQYYHKELDKLKSKDQKDISEIELLQKQLSELKKRSNQQKIQQEILESSMIIRLQKQIQQKQKLTQNHSNQMKNALLQKEKDLNKLQNDYQQLNNKFNLNQKQYQKLEKEKRDCDQRIKQINNQLQTQRKNQQMKRNQIQGIIKQNMINHKREVQSLQKQKQSICCEIKSMNQILEIKSIKIKQFQVQVQKLNNQRKILSQEIERAKTQKKDEYQKFSQQKQKKQNEIQALLENNESLNKIIEKNKKQITQIHFKHKAEQSQKDKQCETKLKQQKQLYFELQNQIKSLNNVYQQKLTEKNRQIQLKNNSIIKLQNQCDYYNKQIDRLLYQCKQLNKKLEENNRNLSQIKQDLRTQFISQYSIALEKQKQKLQDYMRKSNKLIQRQQEIELFHLFYFDQLFQGQILKNKIDYKIRLSQHIKTITKDKNILRTKLMYKYDPKNKTNFHQYIDNKSNLLLLIKTKEQFYITGFYSGFYNSEKIMTDPGLLICLNNNQSYVLNKCENTNQKNKQTELTYKAMQYDKYFIIFGNAQIRIKFGETKIFSNFGVSSSFYNNKGRKRADFLGVQKNQTEFQSYQFYEIQFDKEEDLHQKECILETAQEREQQQQRERQQQERQQNENPK